MLSLPFELLIKGLLFGGILLFSGKPVDDGKILDKFSMPDGELYFTLQNEKGKIGKVSVNVEDFSNYYIGDGFECKKHFGCRVDGIKKYLK